MVFRIPFLFLLCALFACTSPAPSEGAPGADRPNMVLIMTDDQGWGDLGFHGNPDIQTPHIDALAQQSTRFRQFYVSPVCAPTRASLMTGRYSLRTGVFDTYNGGAMMSPEEVTLAEVLRDAGYRTGIFGKWHLGDNYPLRPQDQGFETALVHGGGGVGQVGDLANFYAFDSSYFNPGLLSNGSLVETEGYCSDVYTDGALSFIKSHQEEPFFLYLPFNAPHDPLQLPKEYYETYKDLEFDPARYPAEAGGLPAMSDWDKEGSRKVFGMVQNIDDNVGRVMAQLEELNLIDNTLVIFMSDNGPLHWRYNGGMRGKKGQVYEGGIHVPFFAKFPTGMTEVQEIDIPAAHIDLLPTLCDMLGLQVPGNLDGQSLMPLLREEPVSWVERPLYFYWKRGYEEPYRNVAMRQGNYKMVAHANHDADTTGFELFDLSSDPYEAQDIKARQPQQLAKMRQEYDTWYQDIMQSPHLRSPVRIALGSEAENPVQLNRNDAKGPPAIWGKEKIYGYWAVDVKAAGSYDIHCHFFQHKDLPPVPGHLTVRIGTTQRRLYFEEESSHIMSMKGLPLAAGEQELAVWYVGNDWDARLPFYVEVERTGL